MHMPKIAVAVENPCSFPCDQPIGTDLMNPDPVTMRLVVRVDAVISLLDPG